MYTGAVIEVIITSPLQKPVSPVSTALLASVSGQIHRIPGIKLSNFKYELGWQNIIIFIIYYLLSISFTFINFSYYILAIALIKTCIFRTQSKYLDITLYVKNIYDIFIEILHTIKFNCEINSSKSKGRAATKSRKNHVFMQFIVISFEFVTTSPLWLTNVVLKFSTISEKKMIILGHIQIQIFSLN